MINYFCLYLKYKLNSKKETSEKEVEKLSIDGLFVNYFTLRLKLFLITNCCFNKIDRKQGKLINSQELKKEQTSLLGNY